MKRCLGCSDENDALTDLTNRDVMEANGWTLEDFTDVGHGYRNDNCGTDTFWGWGSSNIKGTAKAILKGSGTAKLDFGNCYSRDNVNVYLNDILLETATSFTSLSVTFAYSDGDVLTINEGNAIMQLHSLEFLCGKNKLFSDLK